MTSESATLYPTAQREARDRLLAGLRTRWVAGDRLPPMRQLAGELAIGVGSVNRAVRALADEGLLVSRPKLGTIVTEAAMALRENRSAKPLLGRRVAIGVTQPAADALIDRWRQLVVDALSPLGPQISFFPLDPYNLRLPGLDVAEILVLVSPNSTSNLAAQDGQALIELTASSGNLKPPACYDLIGADQHHGCLMLGEHLRQCGAESVLFVGVKDSVNKSIYDRTSRARLWSFTEGFGRAIPEEHQVKVKSYGESHGARAAAIFAQMTQRPRAVFAASDDLAVGFVKGALGTGLEPPDDYLIVGFDGQQRGKDLQEGPLTTVEAPIADIVQRLPQMMLERLERPDLPTRRLLLGCTFFAGNTTRPISSGTTGSSSSHRSKGSRP